MSRIFYHLSTGFPNQTLQDYFHTFSKTFCQKNIAFTYVLLQTFFFSFATRYVKVNLKQNSTDDGGRMLSYNTSFIDNQAIIGILRRSCNYVDQRLMDHGIRVSYIVFRLLKHKPECAAAQIRDLCFLASLHDIGAYKTEEISRMVQFETENVWDHSVYGYLFIKYFSPLSAMAPAILFHHTPWRLIEKTSDITLENKYIAQLIYLADRLDIWLNVQNASYTQFTQYLEKGRNSIFHSALVDLLLKESFSTFTVEDIEKDSLFQQMQNEAPFTSEEILSYLSMIIYSIDFRSRHTVTHTMTTTSISVEIARLMDLDSQYRNQIACGALLHDLGKIGIPVEILEFPGKLSPQAMTIMRTHVAITEEIFANAIPLPIQRIALRHHEKLDGSGYPLGLMAEELTMGEMIVALADIVSALAGTRSYKEAFGKEQILSIIAEQKQKGQLSPTLVECMTAHYDQIMAVTSTRCQPILDIYQRLQSEYLTLYDHYAHPDAN